MQTPVNSGNLPPVVVVQQGEVNVHDSPDRDETDPDENEWMHHARCRGVNPTEFFPSDGMGVEAAQRVCEGCAVRTECLEYALAHRIDHGVWGGCSERERRRILKRRRLAVTS